MTAATISTRTGTTPCRSAPPDTSTDVRRRALLDLCQRDFPLVPRPYAELAERASRDGAQAWDEAQLIDALRDAARQGALSRVGPVFAAHGIGSSTLAALAVPDELLERVVADINGLPQVNHNYRRSHHYNLWFVVTGCDDEDVQATLAGIRVRWPALPMLDLPLVNAWYIDLGFPLDEAAHKPPCGAARAGRRHFLSGADWSLVAEIQGGFPLAPRPFLEIALALDRSEQDVIDTLAQWLALGVVRRYGAVLRHRELGYRANAMCVFDIPDASLPAIAEQLAAAPEVRLCYERPRRGTEWPYNLFCMVHGKEPAQVRMDVAAMVGRLGLAGIPHAVLVGEQRYKQRGAWYAPRAGAGARP